MSLINDALKRASGEPAANPDLPSPVPILTPAEPAKGANRGWIYAALAIAVIVAVVLMLRKPAEPVQAKAPAKSSTAAQPPTAAAPATGEKKVFSNPVARAAATLEKVAAQNSEGEAVADAIAAKPVPVTPRSEEATPAATPKPIQVATATPKPAPASPNPRTASKPASFPNLKLQAIYFRLKSPSAVLNGKTLSPGQEIAGAKLIAIHRNSVELEFAGEKRILEMK